MIDMAIPFLDIDEAAEFLRVKRATLYAWIHQRRIPFRKHGRRVIFHRSDLEGWSLRQLVRTRPEDVSSFPTLHGHDMPVVPSGNCSLKIRRTVGSVSGL
jgi:excisionase family DNA binding protein